MTDSTWTRTDTALPAIGRLIEWISPGGIQSRGKFHGGAVWFPEGSNMYVYYRPEFWRYVNDQQIDT